MSANEHKVPYKEKSYDFEITFNVIYNFDTTLRRLTTNFEMFIGFIELLILIYFTSKR